MNKKEQTTLNRIFSAALQEFLEKGYQSASLRNIVKMAGVTTGAFYGYYKSKEELFEALVGKHYNFLLDRFCKAQKEFAETSPEEQPDKLTSTSGECMYEMLLYAYDHLNDCYGFRDLYRAKEKYSPTEWVPSYYVYLPRIPTPDMFYAVARIQNPRGMWDYAVAFVKGRFKKKEAHQ